MPRFVILEHDFPEVHWDFLLEEGTVLKSWRLPRPPVHEAEQMDVMPLPDHRLVYLDYEGPVAGARGEVRRWDHGHYEALPLLAGESFRVSLAGEKFQGIAVYKAGASRWSFQRG